MIPSARLGAREPNVGDLVILLLAETLGTLRDRLVEDGYEPAADLVDVLVMISHDYLDRLCR